MCESFNSFAQNKLKQLYLQESIFDIITNNPTIALLFISVCPQNEISNLYNTILSQMPNTDETLDFRWLIKSFLIQKEDDISEELAMKQFLSFNFAKKILSFNDEYTSDTCQDFILRIQLLRDEFSGLFYIILPTLQNLILKIPTDTIFKSIGSDIISFYTTPPIDFLNQLATLEEDKIPSFFKFHQNFTFPELTTSLQTKISITFQYPSTIQGIENSNFFTLANSSFCQNRHFVDILYELYESEAKEQQNLVKIQNIMQPFLDFIPYFVISKPSNLLHEQFLEKIVKFFEQSSNNSPTIESFLNDFKFLSAITSIAKHKIGYGDLFIYSFPFLIENSMKNSIEILKYSKIKLFSTKESLLSNDFDFICAYNALSLFLPLLMSSQKVPSSSNLNKIFSKISNLLENITNKLTLINVTIDLFSCIFLENQNGDFICHPIVAQQLIQTISTFSIATQILRANSLFERKKVTKGDMSILPWFDNDTSQIYLAIHNKNWPLAEKLSAFYPYYRKFYLQAKQAYQYKNKNDEQIDVMVKLNVLLSTKAQKSVLKEIQKKGQLNDLVNIIIEKRLSNLVEPAFLCSPYQDPDKWQPLLEFCLAFDLESEEWLKQIKQYPQNHTITSTSKSLDDFMNYTYKYYKCSVLIDSGTFDTIEDFFTFNFQKAIEGSIIYDKMEGAEALSRDVNIDLFGYIFKNLSSFDINANFIKGLSEKLPLEAAALSVSSSIFVDFESNMKMIVNYFKDKKETGKETKPKDTLIDSILNLNSDELDDVIYSIDHTELYRQLMRRFDNETIARNYYKIFSCISYVSNDQSDEQRNKAIEILHQVWNVTKKVNPGEIITDLFEKGDECFQMILDFLSLGVNQNQLSSFLLNLFSLSISNPHQIDLILHRFPKYFDIIMVRFYYFDGILPHLIRHCPPYKKNFLNAISLLPKQIINESNIFDIDSIIRTLINNPELILKMNDVIPLLFTNDHLLTILKETISSTFSNRIFQFLLPFFNDKNEVVEFWCDIIDNKLKQMNIDTIEKEDKIVHFFYQLRPSFDLLNHIKFAQYKTLCQFVETRPFLRYHLNYSFEKFRRVNFLNEIISICYKIDEDEIVFDLIDSFEIKANEQFFNRVHLQLILGDFSNAIKFIKKLKLNVDNYRKTLLFDKSFEFIYPFVKMPIVQYEEKEITDFYKTVSNIIKVNSKKSRNSFVVSNDALKALNFVISKHCSAGPSLSLFVSFKKFDQVFNAINMIGNEEERINLFIHDVCLPVFFNGFQKDFEKFILSVDKDLSKTKILWDATINFFSKNRMSHALIFAFQIEKKLEDAAIVGFNALETCHSFFFEALMLNNIVKNLKKSINYRKSLTAFPRYEEEEGTKNDDEVVVPNSTINYCELLYYLKVSELQLDICGFLIEKMIPFTHEFDVFASDECCISISALLFINDQIDIMEEIREFKKLSKNAIFDKVCQFLCREPPQTVSQFAQKLNDIDRLNFLKALSFTNNRQAFLSIICRFYESKKQEYLFLDYNLVVESFAIAYEIKDVEIIPLIAHKASILGDTRTVYECEMFLKDFNK